MSNPLRTEPVITASFLAAAITAVAGILRAFGVYNLTDDQLTALLNAVPVVIVIVGFFVRQQVTPTIKLQPQVPPPPPRPPA